MERASKRTILMFGAWLLALDPASAPAQSLVLQGARLVDPEQCSVTTASVVIEGETIVAITSQPPNAAGARVVDASGTWIIPGLIDAHVHSYGNMTPGSPPMELLGPARTAEVVLRAGVTAFLDLFMPEGVILPLRDRQRAGELRGADIYAAGPILTAPGGHGTEYGVPTRTMSTPAEARRQVAELAARRPDVVKLVYAPSGRLPSIDRPTMEAIVAEAHDRGLPTVVHINTWDEARDAALAGADAVTHLGRGTVPEDLVALLRERRTLVIPTLAVFTDLARIVANPGVLDAPLLRAVTSDAVRAAYRDTVSFSDGARFRLDRARQLQSSMLASVRRLAEGGVTLLAGTDSGNVGAFHGFSLHRELELLVEAGLSPCEAVAAATIAPARFLGVPYGFRSGAVASLVALEASPLDDIRNTQRIAFVVHREQVLEPRPEPVASE